MIGSKTQYSTRLCLTIIMQWPVCINNCRTNVCYTLQFVFAIIAFRCIRLNKCIGENTKGTDRQSPNSIRKTKNTFYRTQVTDPLPKFCKKNCFSTQNFTEIGLLSCGQKRFSMTAIRHLEFWKFSHLSSGCHRVPNVQSPTQFHQNRIIFRWDIEIWRFYYLQYGGRARSWIFEI